MPRNLSVAPSPGTFASNGWSTAGGGGMTSRLRVPRRGRPRSPERFRDSLEIQREFRSGWSAGGGYDESSQSSEKRTSKKSRAFPRLPRNTEREFRSRWSTRRGVMMSCLRVPRRGRPRSPERFRDFLEIQRERVGRGWSAGGG